MEKIKTPIKAIRAKCLCCDNGSRKEVRECTVLDCPIYLYRLGRRPKPEDIRELERKLKARDDE